MWIILQRLYKWHFALCCANTGNRGSQAKGGIRVPKFDGDIGNASLTKLIVTWKTIDCNRYGVHKVETDSLFCQTEDWYFYFNWVCDYVVAVRSSFNSGCLLYLKDTHVYNNRFKSDAPQWYFNWQVETEFLLLMTSCAFGCFVLCICLHSNASRVALIGVGCITFRWARFL